MVKDSMLSWHLPILMLSDPPQFLDIHPVTICPLAVTFPRTSMPPLGFTHVRFCAEVFSSSLPLLVGLSRFDRALLLQAPFVERERFIAYLLADIEQGRLESFPMMIEEFGRSDVSDVEVGQAIVVDFEAEFWGNGEEVAFGHRGRGWLGHLCEPGMFEVV